MHELIRVQVSLKLNQVITMEGNMKRIWNLALCAMLAGTLAACGTAEQAPAEAPAEGNEPAAAETSGPVSLNVTTTFAGEDGNAQNYKNSVAAWESETGNKVVDTSATSDENFKTRVITDFETG